MVIVICALYDDIVGLCVFKGPTLPAQHDPHAPTHHVHHGRPAVDRHGYSASVSRHVLRFSLNSCAILIRIVDSFVGSCTDARPTKDLASSSFSCITSI